MELTAQQFEIIEIGWTLKCFIFRGEVKYDLIPFKLILRQDRCQDGLAVVVRRNINHAYTRSLGGCQPW
jgi:hypothetical protein